MVGNQDEDNNCNGTLSQILALGGYKIKKFVVEGDTNPVRQQSTWKYSVWL